jgi:hypothetical protein
VKCAIKYLDGTKWKQKDVRSLQGKSVATYLAFAKETAIAAILDNDKPVLFVSNDNKIFEPDTEGRNAYKDKGLCINVADLMLLLGSEILPDIAIKVFPNATFVSIESEEEKAGDKPARERQAWWNEKRE